MMQRWPARQKMRAAVAGAIFMVMAAGGAACAADLARGDRRFVEEAVQASAFVVEASRLAVTDAAHGDVRRFAARTVDAQTGLSQQLKALASAKGVKLRTDFKRGQQRTLERLRDDQGLKFDQRYVQKVAIGAYKESVKLFDDQARHGEDPELAALARRTLPALQARLEAGKDLRGAVAAASEQAALTGAVGDRSD